MRSLPAIYRLPKDMIGGFVVTAVFVMLPVGFAALGTGLPGWLSAVILLGTLALLLEELEEIVQLWQQRRGTSPAPR
ncbi:hypothetical protein ACN28C_17695 [Plantactinospora sp. WMMC1484]|uniref:hypothetical protein n=1 Tax=Plantactinospora sp. WMMC1484 TaxID=3404122 RepID=UPI003BF4D55A